MCSPAGRLVSTLGLSVITRRPAFKSGPAWASSSPGLPRASSPCARARASLRGPLRAGVLAPLSILARQAAGGGAGGPPSRQRRLVAIRALSPRSPRRALRAHCGQSHAIAAGDPDAGLPRVSARAVTGRRRCRRSAPRLRPGLAVPTAAPPLACSQVCDVVCETWDFPAECASRQEGPVLAVAASLTCWVLRRRKNHGAALSRGCCLVHP